MRDPTAERAVFCVRGIQMQWIVIPCQLGKIDDIDIRHLSLMTPPSVSHMKILEQKRFRLLCDWRRRRVLVLDEFSTLVGNRGVGRYRGHGSSWIWGDGRKTRNLLCRLATGTGGAATQRKPRGYPINSPLAMT
jgi:hypothetical protein